MSANIVDVTIKMVRIIFNWKRKPIQLKWEKLKKQYDSSTEKENQFTFLSYRVAQLKKENDQFTWKELLLINLKSINKLMKNTRALHLHSYQVHLRIGGPLIFISMENGHSLQKFVLCKIYAANWKSASKAL